MLYFLNFSLAKKNVLESNRAGLKQKIFTQKTPKSESKTSDSFQMNFAKHFFTNVF